MRRGMRGLVRRFTEIGIPASRVALELQFHSAPGQGGREGLQPRSKWLEIVKLEALAARQVTKELGTHSIWSWGWATFSTAGIDRDKGEAVCVYLWVRDPKPLQRAGCGGARRSTPRSPPASSGFLAGTICTLHAGELRTDAVAPLLRALGDRDVARSVVLERLVLASKVELEPRRRAGRGARPRRGAPRRQPRGVPNGARSRPARPCRRPRAPRGRAPARGDSRPVPAAAARAPAPSPRSMRPTPLQARVRRGSRSRWAGSAGGIAWPGARDGRAAPDLLPRGQRLRPQPPGAGRGAPARGDDDARRASARTARPAIVIALTRFARALRTRAGSCGRRSGRSRRQLSRRRAAADGARSPSTICSRRPPRTACRGRAWPRPRGG